MEIFKKTSAKEQAAFGAIVPARNFLKLSRVLSSYPDRTVSIYQDEDKQRLSFVFGDGEIEVTINLTEGTYPEYSKLLPEGFTTEIVVDRRALTAVASRISLFVRDPAPSIVFKWTKSELTVRSVDSQTGGTEEQLPAKTKELEKDSINTITLNVRHLLEALQAVESNQIKIQVKEKLKPCILLDDKDKVDYQHVLMPMYSSEQS